MSSRQPRNCALHDAGATAVPILAPRRLPTITAPTRSPRIRGGDAPSPVDGVHDGRSEREAREPRQREGGRAAPVDRDPEPDERAGGGVRGERLPAVPPGRLCDGGRRRVVDDHAGAGRLRGGDGGRHGDGGAVDDDDAVVGVGRSRCDGEEREDGGQDDGGEATKRSEADGRHEALLGKGHAEAGASRARRGRVRVVPG